MKNISWIIAFFFLFLSNSCNNSEEEIKDFEIKSVVMNIEKDKANVSSMIIILDLESDNIIICNSLLETPEVPPPPPGFKKESLESGSKKIDAEIIPVSEKEIVELKKILDNFGNEDYEDRIKTSIDGMGVSITFIMKNNQIKEFDLINDSTENQVEFFKLLFNILKSKSKNSDYINNIYPS